MENNKVLHGSDGFVYFNGTQITNLKSIDLKITAKFEEFTVCGDYKTYQRFVGYSVEGSLKLQKMDSTALKIVSDGYKSGLMPDIQVVTKLLDKSTGQAERSSVSGLVFTELNLGFETKGLVETELPFKASDYEILETITL